MYYEAQEEVYIQEEEYIRAEGKIMDREEGKIK